MEIIMKWIKQLDNIENTGRLDNPMIEPQVAKVGACIAAALLTIAEVIAEK